MHVSKLLPPHNVVSAGSYSNLGFLTLNRRNFAGVDVLRGLPWAISALKHPAAGAPSLHGPGSVPEDCAAQPLESNVPEDAFPVPARPNISGAHPQESIKPRPLVSRSPVDWQADLPPFPKITADDERMASVEGHFLARLKEAEMVDDSGKPTELGRSEVSQLRATYIHLMINKMLSMNRRYQTVLAVVRDVGCYMSPVNLATAMHRLGRLARAARATRPNLPQQLCQHPQYRFMLQRAEESISSMSPRAVANFLWGMAAMGDNKNTGIVLRLGQRLMELDPRDLKTQELSNVVWGLATLEVHMPQLLDRMLDSVSMVEWSVSSKAVLCFLLMAIFIPKQLNPSTLCTTGLQTHG